ncbi:MAG: protein kinase, partial [Myxococcota bacterium]
MGITSSRGSGGGLEALLCYRCGSYNADDARKCSVCKAPLSAPRRRSPEGREPKRGGRGPFEPGHVVAERYRIVDATAQGSSGWIFRATDEVEGGDVAVKVISSNLLQTDSERAQFAKTLKAAKRVHHTNVAPVQDSGRHKSHAFYVMPFLEGLNLRKIIDLRLEKKQTFALSEVLPLISQIAQACDAWGRYGHHGAIRPASVVVLP